MSRHKDYDDQGIYEWSTSKLVLSGEPTVKKRKEQPWVRWLEKVENDLRKVNITDWRRGAAERRQWRNIIGNYYNVNR